MKWRKVIALFLTLVTACSLLAVSGCGKSAPSDNKEDADVSSDSDTEETEETGYYTAEDYLADPSLFTPVWADEWDVPEEMTNFEEKWESWFDPDGRLMSLIHRAEGSSIYYPENSIEAILSCIAAGADMIEIDIWTTKDGHYVLMHDQSLVRTTNVSSMRHAGAVGFPESDLISDWTLEQLRRLRLTMTKPDGTVEVTNYVIPTLDDVLMVAADKIFIMLDINDTYEFDFEKDFYPLVQKYNAYRSIGIPLTMMGNYTEDKMNELIETIKKDSGHDKVMMQFNASAGSVANVVKLIEENGWVKFLRGGTYSYALDEVFKPYFGKYRVHTNAIFSDIEDTRENWEMLHNKGYNSIHTDYYVDMGKYIEELYFSK